MKKQLIIMGTFFALTLGSMPSFANCCQYLFQNSVPVTRTSCPAPVINNCCPAAPCCQFNIVKPCCAVPVAEPCCEAPKPCPCPAAPITQPCEIKQPTHKNMCD